MESRYAQERVCSSCRPRFASLAANRVRGIVGIIEPDRDVDRQAGWPGDQRSAEQRATTRFDRAACSEVCHRLGARHGQRQVVYAYDKDPKGGTPACTGSCAKIWLPVTGGHPVASPADKGLGTLGTVTTANGAKQITYNGSPLYTFKGAKALVTNGNGVGGVWHVIKMSENNIVGGAG